MSSIHNKEEETEVKALTSKEIRRLIENCELKDKIYLDDDWEEWLFLYTKDENSISDHSLQLYVTLASSTITISFKKQFKIT